MTKASRTWGVAQAKAHLSIVIDYALAEGPQTITRSGRRAAVLVSAEDWDRKRKRQGNLTDFFASSPLRGARLRVKRRTDRARSLALVG
jgi:prevent-host-death family protein